MLVAVELGFEFICFTLQQMKLEIVPCHVMFAFRSPDNRLHHDFDNRFSKYFFYIFAYYYRKSKV